MKLNTLMTTALLSATLSVTVANAATVERFVDIEGKTYKLTEVRKNNYDYYSAQLKNHLAELKSTQDFGQFQTLVNEASQLAKNAKRTVKESMIDRYEGQDNAREMDTMIVRSGQINRLISSLEKSSQQNDLTTAKQAILFKVAGYL
ncbi:hypothetical protein PTQ27_08035 [Mannheimia sp. AT1]|uniref:Uncharacterized protein n=1 Tax=Mannheimia cairinae TaxID=3025936 RepID=A0ABT5MSD6_9PAST|nr:hypothetical protein [Mannheimia cairinae]MDD0824409.1 hypothetical protein [Mannheimia cairinae]MDD0825510.1 hypothetical protein [Mannheimia cairinae]